MTELEQNDALRSGRGFVVLAGWSVVTVMGRDRQSFLNSFCTNDVKRLVDGESCEAFFTNVKGKIVGHGLMVCIKPEIDVVTVPDQAGRLIDHLARYVIREDIILHDATNERTLFLVTGQQRATRGWGKGWELLGPTECAIDPIPLSQTKAFHDELSAEGLMECGLRAFDTLRIESGTPFFGVDFDEQNLPQEVGRDQEAISFTKGCYLGQETVARIDALGHVNQRIAGVRFDDSEIPAAGTELLHGDVVVGRVTSATFSPRLNKPLALAMVRRAHLAVGSRLESRFGPSEVVALPLP